MAEREVKVVVSIIRVLASDAFRTTAMMILAQPWDCDDVCLVWLTSAARNASNQCRSQTCHSAVLVSVNESKMCAHAPSTYCIVSWVLLATSVMYPCVASLTTSKIAGILGSRLMLLDVGHRRTDIHHKRVVVSGHAKVDNDGSRIAISVGLHAFVAVDWARALVAVVVRAEDQINLVGEQQVLKGRSQLHRNRLST
jgi:hypothetical protein